MGFSPVALKLTSLVICCPDVTEPVGQNISTRDLITIWSEDTVRLPGTLENRVKSIHIAINFSLLIETLEPRGRAIVFCVNIPLAA